MTEELESEEKVNGFCPLVVLITNIIQTLADQWALKQQISFCDLTGDEDFPGFPPSEAQMWVSFPVSPPGRQYTKELCQTFIQVLPRCSESVCPKENVTIPFYRESLILGFKVF
ncbi:hypothetical protein AVEN_263735-1 [Araneus ventricosus]|uniref:Uncharacterized protein n=1 Tax=Araneus ventricosus TaxID=182803 RepID=A0A4Y2AU06_ARAVE|nr:hypothetical protein AVEN_263735-1 [Araneus ventricosus]